MSGFHYREGTSEEVDAVPPFRRDLVVGASAGGRPARHGTPIEPGTVYVAPPDRHLRTGDGVLVLTQDPADAVLGTTGGFGAAVPPG